ncbi:DNA-3-methyladenine glycosylase I [Saccharibacter sp. 17.LH.SD]|uniref:DNA-3-methyladenine glycosylase I n=1 Tax=Saccharibacter sp. 17.LH.SD TaxID=2689393 RepID=UPI00136C15E3|nr:DNA-3-methyladenine glycosylase I [Saccharibacter sp. 17.LH.SD]MXV44428.1 DNA-3-methyladenine glycosylase I [Saccharibacter sp. 17.LH.SD]
MNNHPYRCAWAQTDPIMRDYHDKEWGIPIRDSRTLWEKLILDGFQAGLSWRIILLKREAFREAFDGFIPEKIARYGEDDIKRLLGNPNIVRSSAKIRAAIKNANAYLAMQEHGEDFASFIWNEVGNNPLKGDGTGSTTRSPLGDRLSAALKKRGFSFVGPIIVHAWLQATGVINDHEDRCFRSDSLIKGNFITIF